MAQLTGQNPTVLIPKHHRPRRSPVVTNGRRAAVSLASLRLDLGQRIRGHFPGMVRCSTTANGAFGSTNGDMPPPATHRHCRSGNRVGNRVARGPWSSTEDEDAASV